jgi:(R,R)-butanediol dehydrogenase/meso-butanediol dehydrogenase/diacetyl reductase
LNSRRGEELNLVGVWAHSVHDWARVAAQVDSGAFPVEGVVTSTIPLSRIVEGGFDNLLDPAGDEIKILVEPA